MVGCGVARLYLQGSGVISHSCIIAAQAVIGESSVVESSAVAGIELNGSAVVPEGLLKLALHSSGLAGWTVTVVT